ncbi:MAG: M48 family metalloprotease, partial [Vampirovibrionia bacterium]
MRIKYIILSFLVLSLFVFVNSSQKALAENFAKSNLLYGQAEQGPPTDAITSQYGFTLVSELAAGRTVAYALLEKFDNKVNTDPELNHYVNLVGQSVAKAASNRPQVKYKFGIIDSDEINAFACPGGYIFVTTGLLKVVYDENELAAVLAHEIGHIEHGDGLKDLQSRKNDDYKDAQWDKVENNAALVGDVATSLPYAGWYASYYSPKNMAKRGIGRAIGSIGGGYGGYVARSAAYSATDAAVDVATDQAYKGLKSLARKIGKKYILNNYYNPLSSEIEFQA